jgi:hypothetical protein
MQHRFRSVAVALGLLALLVLASAGAAALHHKAAPKLK